MAFLRITLIILGLLLVTSEAGTCGDDWFGSKCQYKCRCTDNKCDDNGICKDGSKCSTGWFGPACQYADLAANSLIKQYGSSVQYDELTDGDEQTCVDVSSFKSVTMDWTTPYPFTWMRIDLHRPDRNNGFEIQFKNKSDTNIISNCNNQKMFLISPTTIDIHCDLDVAVDQVIVSWKNVGSICSVYISGAMLEGFILESFANDGSHLLNHKDKQGLKDVYTVLSVGVKEPVSQVKITLTATVSDITALRLCEVQIYGDSQCPKGQYGLECNKRCNCAKDEDCFVSTGGCPSGCPIGFYGDECREGCPTSYHGVDCLESCSNTYRNQSCDRVSGKCHGCIDGKQGAFCTKDCLKGKYGQDCKESCSEFCEGDGSCDPYNGTCTHGCKAGYQGAKCNEKCPTSYHGVDCLESCNKTCRNQSCDRVSGKCHGCVDGKQGDFCTNEDSTANSLWLQIGIGVTFTFLLILAVVLFLFRKRNISKSETREDDRPRDDGDVVLYRQEERPYENLNEDADGYSRLQSSHSPGFELRERDAFDNNATCQNDSTYSHLRDC